MVTVQDVGLQLTKPVKELAEWNYPFSQTLETYCSLFNTTSNKSFGEAGLVLQNSTAVYIQRIDYLWNKMAYFRNVFSSHEHEEVIKNSIKRRDRKTDVSFQDFTTINFAEEVDKNIDIRKNHVTQDTVKLKSYRFTQLEKGFTQYIPIDIYDVNGEIIGKKYDFRCNQSINMDGVLIDEFAPQDFYCDNDGNNIQEKSISTNMKRLQVTKSMEHSQNTLAIDSAVHENSDEHVNSDQTEFERNDDDSLTETSNLVTSLESHQNLSLFANSDATTDVSAKTSNEDCNDSPLFNASNETLEITRSNNSSICNSTTVDDGNVSNNSESEIKCLSNDVSTDNGSHLLDSPKSMINSQNRALSTDDLILLNSTDEDSRKAKLLGDHTQNTSPAASPRQCKSRSRSRSKSITKSCKQSPITARKRGHVTKNLLSEFRKKSLARVLEENSVLSQADRPNISTEDSDTCKNYTRQLDSVQYDTATATSTDDDETEFHSSSPVSLLCESLCDSWFRSNSPSCLPAKVDRWHELMQPKLREAEQRSTFCIRDYASRIMESVKESDQKKVSFDNVIRGERACEVARYFLASLDLASRQNVEINAAKDLEHNIEIVLHEEDRQCFSNNQVDSGD